MLIEITQGRIKYSISEESIRPLIKDLLYEAYEELKERGLWNYRHPDFESILYNEIHKVASRRGNSRTLLSGMPDGNLHPYKFNQWIAWVES